MANKTPNPFPTYKRMQTFQYEGLDKKNARITGEIAAASITRARATLLNQGITTLKIKKKTTSVFSFRKKKVKSFELTLFTRQLATLIAAGIPLVQALGVIADGLPSTALGDLTRNLKIDVESGSPFSTAIRRYPAVFDDLYCSLIQAGEQSGTLDTMLERLAAYKEKSDSLKRKVMKAMYYPTAVILIAVIVTIILLLKVVPTFKEMFKGFGSELPWFTLRVLDISELIQNYGLYILGGLVFFVYFTARSYRNNVAFRNLIQRLMLKLPVLGPILKKTAIARFARTLATTAAAGLPLTEGLDLVGKATGNSVFANAVLKIKDGLTTGQQVNTVMKKTEVFPTMVVQMVAIGEESGTLEAMLEKVASIFEEEVDTAVDGLTTLLEPLIMVLLGVIVGGLVIAMYLPIFKMGSVV